ncbi:MAG: glycosyltransferase family 39 protein, partial [Chloroflexota bacterium]|nr:glycosyltransferase family 39 protein [Chloroflexota bacterium]
MSSVARRVRPVCLRLSTNAAVAAPLALYGIALLVRMLAIVPARFPMNEGSAYYVAVAQNLAAGRGLVIDAIWSYATPPLDLPRPAFELWQPMASFVAAIPMTLFGSSLLSAQLAFALLGALVAPLAWLAARDAASLLGLDESRAASVTLGSGLLAALLGPFLVATAAPDSTTPFTIFGTLACLLMPRALARGGWWSLALGITLGLAFLARMEAVYLGLTFLLLMALAGRRVGGRRGGYLRLLGPVIAGGAVVSLPWLVRNSLTFEGGFGSQALENVFFTRNEDVFAYLQRPDLETFLAQGAGTIAANIGVALWHGLFDVVLLWAAPVGIVGLATGIVLLRRGELRTSGLGALLISGLLTYLITSLVLPVATRWGTFQHAAGPLLVGLTVAAVLGTDRLLAELRRRRRWPRSNAWLGPLALAAMTVPLST